MKKLTNTLFVLFLMAGISVNAQNTKTKSASAVKANNVSKAKAATATMIDPADSEAVQQKKATKAVNTTKKAKTLKITSEENDKVKANIKIK